MSWSATTPGAVTKTQAGTAVPEHPQTQPELCEGPAADQVAAAQDAAIILAAACGTDVHDVIVTAGGHANPGHGDVHGWSPEWITVTVYAQAPAIAVEDHLVDVRLSVGSQEPVLTEGTAAGAATPVGPVKR